MTRQVFDFSSPDRFIVGTVGTPGDRTFFLQASEANRTVSVAMEKMQAVLLADRLAELLAEAHTRLGAEIPDIPEHVDSDPLNTPIEPEFRVGSMGLIWDAANSTVVVEASAEGDADEPDDNRDLLRVRINPSEARAFIARTAQILAAGRPPCPLCAMPLDPDGHLCPRSNSYQRRVEA